MPLRRALAVRPVNSLKHVIDTNGAVSLAVQSVNDIVASVDSPATTTTPTQCHIGSVVKSFFLRVEVVGSTASGGVQNIYLAVFKNQSNASSIANIDKIGISTKRKFVIHQEMIMLAPFVTGATQFPRTLFKGVIKIPKIYQRNGESDKIQVLLQHRNGEASQVTDFCMQAIYKEFY